MANKTTAGRVLDRRSPLAIRFFEYEFARQLRQHFNAVRLSRHGGVPILDERPLVVYSNHPSWWEAVVYFHLGRTLFRDRVGYGPVDAAQLTRYPLLDRLGIFGIEPNTAPGARRFLEVGRALFARTDSMMWVSAEGRFTDPRKRPVVLRRGIARLAQATPRLVFLPLAIEHQFWDEKRPELLLRFGQPIEAGVDNLETALEAGLTQAMDSLATETSERDPALFEALLCGDKGIHRAYDLLRRIVHAASGRTYRSGHRAE